MKRLLGYGSLLASSTLLTLAAQPVYAAATVITGVEVVPTQTGAQIFLKTEAGDVPQVFAVNQGNRLRADIVRTELQLPEGNAFVQQDPAPGIAAVSLTSLDDNSVRLTVDGSNQIPVGTVGESANGGILIDIATQGTGAAPPSTPVPRELNTVPGPDLVAQAEEEPVEAAPVEAAPEEAVPQIEGEPDVLVPNPQVVIDGVPVLAPEQQQLPPFLPAAVPPPVGDIAVSESIPDFGEIDLGTSERIPRLVLRAAPSREVLTLLGRTAGLNVVFISGAEGDESTEGPPITLDIENESVQEVFNSVLRVAGLQANRVGRTIYVGTSLPVSAQNVVVRTLRMNQVDAAEASNFLVALGAERAVSRQREVSTAVVTDVEEGIEGDGGETRTFTEDVVDTDRADFQDSVPIFRGLQVVAEERTNTVTLVGSPELVELATAQLVKIDLRKRQVAINLKVIDIDLDAIDALGTSFSFSTGDFDFASQGGVGVINFGGNIPGGTTFEPETTPIGVISNLASGGVVGIAQELLSQVFATVEEGNAKILTDPTLIVQEGQTASVQLTEEVVTDFDVDQEFDDGFLSTTIDIETEPAGLVLNIDLNRIDDNGFVTLSVAPSITAPVGTQSFSFTGVTGAFITLLSERQLSSGLVRVRDGQTLVLSGIIQETDRTIASKIPILGDLPIIGSLFRSTVREDERLELIVMLTPEILDDSDQSTFGYSYSPSEEVQELLEQQRVR